MVQHGTGTMRMRTARTATAPFAAATAPIVDSALLRALPAILLATGFALGCAAPGNETKATAAGASERDDAGVDDAPGKKDDSSDDGERPPSPTGDDKMVVQPVTCELGELVRARVRRLTEKEFNNTVAYVFGRDDLPKLSFPQDPIANGYANKSEQLRVTGSLAQLLWLDTEGLADAVADDLVKAAGCNDGADCARSILEPLAERAYRGKSNSETLDELVSVAQDTAEGLSFEDGIKNALRVLLQSSEFIYNTELGAPDSSAPDKAGTGVKLTPGEIASQLSYLVTGGPPDTELLQLANDSKALFDPDTREIQVRRLLQEPGARERIGDFAEQWMELLALPKKAKDVQGDKDWSKVLPDALQEMRTTVADAVLSDGASLADLFLFDRSRGTAALAEYYDATIEDGWIELPEERRGFLTLGAFLADNGQAIYGSPVKRGHFVRVRLLCQDVPPPPADLIVNPPAEDPTQSARDRFVDHSTDKNCWGCHVLIDPIGYAFSNFDGAGRRLTDDNGHTVDTSGDLALSDVDGALKDAVDLSEKLSRSQQARECFAGHLMEFSAAATVQKGSRCAVDEVASEFVAGKANIEDLLVALTRSELMTNRAPQQ